MFSDYKEAVIKTYENKKELGLLSINLERPTPAKLREECLLVIAERFSPIDEKALRAFFGTHNTAEEYAQTIRFFDIEKFKPLINFLKRETVETDDKNIELLSWLLDIKPRPFKLDFNYETNKAVKQPLLEGIGNNDEKQGDFRRNDIKEEDQIHFIDSPINADMVKKKTGWKAALILCIILAGGIALFFTVKGSMNYENCMYWKKDHYELVDCNLKNPTIHIIAADEFKLEHFKKITTVGTLSKDCIGKIWYSKIDKSVEFFTLAGMHPEHQEKSLKLVTEHIYTEYILKEKGKQ